MVARRESASWEIPSGIGAAPKIGSVRAGPVRLRVTGRVGGPAGQCRDLSADHPSQTPNRADGAVEAGGLGFAPVAHGGDEAAVAIAEFRVGDTVALIFGQHPINRDLIGNNGLSGGVRS